MSKQIAIERAKDKLREVAVSLSFRVDKPSSAEALDECVRETIAEYLRARALQGGGWTTCCNALLAELEQRRAGDAG